LKTKEIVAGEGYVHEIEILKYVMTRSSKSDRQENEAVDVRNKNRFHLIESSGGNESLQIRQHFQEVDMKRRF